MRIGTGIRTAIPASPVRPIGGSTAAAEDRGGTVVAGSESPRDGGVAS